MSRMPWELEAEERRAKNVILLVGDGMGQAHRLAAQLASVGIDGRLVMDRLPCAGLMGTACVDPATFVTDSAAAATALATGVKTRNGAVAVDPNGRPVPTILELAKHAGKATGLITTCQITDATPAAFGAHVPARGDQSEIARQYVEETGVDVILGGGEDWWYPAGDPGAFGDDPNGDGRERSRGAAGDLVARARGLGYDYVTDRDGLRATEGPKVLGLFANEEMFRQAPEGERDGYDPLVSLAEMTATAIARLSRNPEGFFLVVEEAAIDRMAHRNNAGLALRGVLELDKAAAVAVAYAEVNPDTLLIVTADHECGGLAIAGADDAPYPYEPGAGTDGTAAIDLAGEDGPFPVAGTAHRFVMGWATTGHTAAAVPVTAMGPGAERLVGVYENTEVFEVMVAAMKLGVPVG